MPHPADNLAALVIHLQKVRSEQGEEAFQRECEKVASSLLGVLAQRLVRRLCPHCKTPYTPSETELQDLMLDRGRIRDRQSHPGPDIACLRLDLPAIRIQAA